MLPIWDETLFPRWQSLTVVHLSGCALTDLSPTVGRLTNLRELHADNNLLTALPGQPLILPNRQWHQKHSPAVHEQLAQRHRLDSLS